MATKKNKKKVRTIADRKEELRTQPKDKKLQTILDTLSPAGIVKKGAGLLSRLTSGSKKKAAEGREAKRFKALIKRDPKEKASNDADKLFEKRMNKLGSKPKASGAKSDRQARKATALSKNKLKRGPILDRKARAGVAEQAAGKRKNARITEKTIASRRAPGKAKRKAEDKAARNAPLPKSRRTFEGATSKSPGREVSPLQQSVFGKAVPPRSAKTEAARASANLKVRAKLKAERLAAQAKRSKEFANAKPSTPRKPFKLSGKALENKKIGEEQVRRFKADQAAVKKANAATTEGRKAPLFSSPRKVSPAMLRLRKKNAAAAAKNKPVKDFRGPGSLPAKKDQGPSLIAPVPKGKLKAPRGSGKPSGRPKVKRTAEQKRKANAVTVKKR